MSESLKSKTVSGVLWSAIERFSLQGVQFIINILMARLLLPSDYGMIGMLAVFLQISQTFIDSVWGIERSGFFNGREKWAKGFENQRV